MNQYYGGQHEYKVSHPFSIDRRCCKTISSDYTANIMDASIPKVELGSGTIGRGCTAKGST